MNFIVSLVTVFLISQSLYCQDTLFARYHYDSSVSAMILKDIDDRCLVVAYNSLGVRILNKSYLCSDNNINIDMDFYNDNSIKTFTREELTRNGSILVREKVNFDNDGLKINSEITRHFVSDFELDSFTDSTDIGLKLVPNKKESR